MNLIRRLEEITPAVRRGAVTIGNFDGVHRGHAVLLARLVALAREVNGPAVVFTFDPHPAELLYPDAVPPPLTWLERKAELLGELGADVVIAYPTDSAVLSFGPREFFQEVIRHRLEARAMVEGPNFFFGRDRAGSIDDLRTLCDEDGLKLEIVEPLMLDGQYVSSSWIRELIAAGDIRAADALLTRPYRVHGRVVRGAGRGASIGFPTANLEPLGMVLPPFGVYAGCARVDGERYAAAVNIGPNPTFGEQATKFEAHLIGCHDVLYGRLLQFDFIDRLRGVRSFRDVESLQRQLGQDVEAVKRIMGAM